MTVPRAGALLAAATVIIVLATACGQKPSPESAALADVIRGARTAALNVDTLPDIQAGLAKYYSGLLLARKATQDQTPIRPIRDAGGGEPHAGPNMSGVKR